MWEMKNKASWVCGVLNNVQRRNSNVLRKFSSHLIECCSPAKWQRGRIKCNKLINPLEKNEQNLKKRTEHFKLVWMDLSFDVMQSHGYRFIVANSYRPNSTRNLQRMNQPCKFYLSAYNKERKNEERVKVV